MIEVRSSNEKSNKLIVIRKKGSTDKVGDLVCNVIKDEKRIYCNFMKQSITLEDLNNIAKILNAQT